ncbi:hypothetical protein [Terrihalobacillus insolitus]|uniref:hypothetical protein n=1 Tax=Terrihalobacillus insolitus TaxID=2950438 RepID=UPI002341B68B|nr:hypothetical protein [Terrihalobacillus insolitus]MDC3414265.1 hypothetical protein [Terrihalobacillus insolitus]
MFAKNKPTKRIDLPENHWVELQHLSKGTKDVLKSSVTKIFNKFDSKMMDGKMDDVEFSPDFVEKIQEIEYQKLAAAIRAWSAEEEVTVENIKELDDEPYELILKEVNNMNELSEEEEKN